jgi:hypothetical protein
MTILSMKNRVPQSAFFNPRVLIALLGFGTFAVPAASIVQARQSYTNIGSIDPLIPAGFDCSKIHKL